MQTLYQLPGRTELPHLLNFPRGSKPWLPNPYPPHCQAATSAQPIVSGADYIQSLRGRNLKVHFLGERISEPVDHPVIRPSINAVARTYDLAIEHPELATARSSLSNRRVNRFLHVTESVEDVVGQNRMQRRLGQLTGTCFQRCVGMDAINSLYSVTYDMDQACGTDYHARLRHTWCACRR